MNFVLKILSILVLTITSSYGANTSFVECRQDDPTIMAMQETLATRDIKNFIIRRFAELEIEIIEDSIASKVNINDDGQLEIATLFLTKLGSQVQLKSGYYHYDEEGNILYHDLNVFYRVMENIERNREGIPTSRTCRIENSGYSYEYQFLNSSYDNYQIDRGFFVDGIFSSGHTYPITL